MTCFMLRLRRTALSRLWRKNAYATNGIASTNTTRKIENAQLRDVGDGRAYEDPPNPLRLAKATTASRTNSASATSVRRVNRDVRSGSGCIYRLSTPRGRRG